jgi:hypothetical protein
MTRAFRAFKLNSLDIAMRQNLVVHQTQQQLSQKMKTNIQMKLRALMNRSTAQAFAHWKNQCEFNKKMIQVKEGTEQELVSLHKK